MIRSRIAVIALALACGLVLGCGDSGKKAEIPTNLNAPLPKTGTVGGKDAGANQGQGKLAPTN
ncbi:MAG: hypothetical protein ACRCZF_07955 [Gemmataceae bacterium]